MLEIIQDIKGQFHLKNGPRAITLTIEQVEELYPDIRDIDDFDYERAKDYYGV